VEYVPRTDAECVLWRKFRQAIQIYNLFAIGCLVLLMAVIHWGYEAGSTLIGPLFLLLLPAALYFTANRFDILPALFMALSLACLGRRWPIASAMFMGAAAMLKVYPILAAILAMRYLSKEKRQCAVWAGTFGLTIFAILMLAVSHSGWDGALAPYQHQLSRSMESFTIYGVVIPEFLGHNNLPGVSFRLGTVMATLLLMAWTRPPDLASLLRRTLLLLIVFVSLQVFYSPQWILWLTPLWVPLARSHRLIAACAIALDLVTYLTFPVVYDLNSWPYQGEVLSLLTLARFFVLGALAGLIVRAEFWGKDRANS
jgi:hypothetical protein